MTAIANATVNGDGTAIQLDWEDGSKARFHAVWLRDNALDAVTRDPGNGQRLITLADIPEDLKISMAQVDGDLSLRFSGNDTLYEYSSDWLRDHRYDLAEDRAPGWLPAGLETFDGRLNPAAVGAEFKALKTDTKALQNWLSQVARFGFGCVSDGPVASGALLDLVALFGFVRETNYGRWFEVRTEINPTNLAYTGLGLQAHTDNPYRDPLPTLQLLYCLENSAEGGDSQVVDGFHAAHRLRNEAPEDFEMLSRHCARFNYRGTGGVHLSSRKPMIELAPDGELVAVRFNNRSAAPITDVPYDLMAKYYGAYRRFGQIIDDPAMAVSFKLEPGQSFLVDNTRVLHARTGYAATGGARWLQGCYADKDGLLSTLAILEAKQEQAA